MVHDSLAVQDGVYMLSLEPQLIHGYTEAILTPNVVEFARLYSAVVRETAVTESRCSLLVIAILIPFLQVFRF